MYDRQIYALIIRYTRDQDLANDIYQEIFMNVYKNLNSFAFKSEFYTWLYRVAANTALSYIKRETRFRHGDDNVDDMVEHSNSNEDTMLMYDLLNEAEKLPEKQKIVFFMRFQNDLKIDEIAEVLNIDSGTVKGYLSRSVKKIRQSLKIA